MRAGWAETDPSRTHRPGGEAASWSTADRAASGRGGHSPAHGLRVIASALRADATHEPTLIAVPNLEGAPNDRDVTASGLKERHAAIWTLAETGATADVIARATGQPVGQIELILGLRRQIDGTKSSSTHAPHA